MEFTVEECQKWIKNPGVNPKNGHKLNTNAKDGMFARLQKRAIELGLNKLVNEQEISPVPIKSDRQLSEANITEAKPTPKARPVLPLPLSRINKNVTSSVAESKPSAVAPAQLVVPTTAEVETSATTVSRLATPTVAKPATVTQATPAGPTPKMVLPNLSQNRQKQVPSFNNPSPALTVAVPNSSPNPNAIPKKPVLLLPLANRTLKKPEEAKKDPEIHGPRQEEEPDSSKKSKSKYARRGRQPTKMAKYYIFTGLKESESGMIVLIHDTWKSLVEELSKNLHLMENLVEHGMSVVQIPVIKSDYKDFIKFEELEGNDDPSHPYHYLHSKHQIPSLSKYINRTYEQEEARLTIEFLEKLEKYFPDLITTTTTTEELIKKIDSALKDDLEDRQEWDEKYLEYFTDDIWFYVDFQKIMEDLNPSDFKNLCTKTYKKRLPDPWLPEQYRDSEDIEEFLAHLELTIDDMFGTSIAMEGYDDWEERLNNITSEYINVRKEYLDTVKHL